MSVINNINHTKVYKNDSPKTINYKNEQFSIYNRWTYIKFEIHIQNEQKVMFSFVFFFCHLPEYKNFLKTTGDEPNYIYNGLQAP